MNKYQILALRYHKMFKYLLKLFIVFLVLFLIVTAINNGSNKVLTFLSGFTLLLTIATGIELPILYLLSKIMLNKGK